MSETTPETNGNVANAPVGAKIKAAELKSEEPPKLNSTAINDAINDGDEPDEAEDEDPDEEENLFSSLEAEEAKQSLAHALDAQPSGHEASAAPTLLRDAIAKGEVGVDDSEVESEEGYRMGVAGKKEVAAKKDGGLGKDGGGKIGEGTDKGEEKKAGEEDEGEKEQPMEEHHIHHRNNQLDFLLSKASEYSNFIANDLQELQSAMTADAQATLSKQEKKDRKKRKSEGKEGGKKKKSKKNNGKSQGEENLASAHDQYNKSFGGSGKPIFIQPKNLANGCKLKDYQLEGVRWLVSLYENGVSGILADEMGLGKTIQVISLIAHLRTMSVPGPFIVVAPLATLPNWVREFQKWLPSLPVCRFHGNSTERDAMLNGVLNKNNRKNADYPVLVTSYEVAIRDEKRLNKIGPFQYLVVDEGQRLKNHRCTLISSLKRIRSHNRLLLSGTPIQNNLDELWSLLNFVNPAIFDDLSIFQSWFGFKNIGQKSQGSTKEEEILMEQRKNQTVTKLHDILRPFLLRRIKKDVLSDMPPKKEIVVYAGMSKLQQGYAQLIDQGVLRDVLLNQGIEQARTLSQTNKLMNHRKNCNHPFMFGEPIDPATGAHVGSAHPHLLIRASGKFALLDRMLERLFKDKHQVLIFSQMTSLLNVIEDYLILRNWKYCRIDGSTKIDERQRQMDVFNAEKTAGENGTRNDGDDRHFVFLLSTRAGGLGINLATADTCIIFDSDWNPHQDSQAMDRCHRIGQNRPVAVYRLLTVNSVDIDMMEKQISKKKLERMAIVGGDFRKAGIRSRGEFSDTNLTSLLEDDVKDLKTKGIDADGGIRISDYEFEAIMNRERLFAEGEAAIATEGKMYDVIDANKGDVLGAMTG
mmetsp:Transcript_33320/g.67904  ORF Transcript_33320/g.67904 Transcript_33320/m.67904 type:complete len:865 (-) Transcript_33320:319-2913(-)